jgi:ELWxxDGT repeat protein
VGPGVAGQEVTVVLSLPNDLAGLAGRLLGPDGQPLRDTFANVDFDGSPAGGGSAVSADGDGRFLFLLGPHGPGAEIRSFRLWRKLVGGPMLRAEIAPRRLTASADFSSAVCSAGTFAWLTIGTTAAGAEPWRTDGTNAGTMMVKDIVPGAGGSFASEYTVVGSRWVYFRASDRNAGFELWRSDGTSAGTTLVQDIWPGPAPSNPGELTVSRGRVFFVADDGVHGAEPWVLATGAVATAHGTGCGGGTALPAMDATDPILGSTSRFTGRAMPGAAGMLLLSRFGPPTDLTNDCTLFLDPTLLIGLATFVPSAGTWSTMVPIPNDASLTGITVATQALSAPGASVLGVALSNRVELTFGQ